MKQVELIEKRKPREKHFLREDGTILAEVYDTDIHYLKDGKYEEIDNTLVSENGILKNKSNDYKVEFKENFKESLMKMTKKNHYIDFKVRESNIGNIKSYKRKLSKQMKNTTYNNITDDITVEYQALSDKVKETIVLQNSNYSELSFELDTNLILSKENGEIIARDENEKIIFRIEKPYMIDSNKIRNDNVYYKINSFDYGYLLTLVLDEEWLNSNERVYPVYVDPTISNTSQNISLYDTYIYPGDTNDKRSDLGYLVAGVDKLNGQNRINRTLIKFDLPVIGTGYEIIEASINLIPCLGNQSISEPYEHLVEIHRITADWTESGANWNTMNDKYDNRVEYISPTYRSSLSNNTIEAYPIEMYITGLVKKWYEDTPNYGIMIKSCNENYINDNYPMFFSNNNTVNGNPKPLFTIKYRNKNGIESYWDYKEQSFTDGKAYVNTHTGNLTTVFNLGTTIGGVMPASLKLVYNTNDVVLGNETFFKRGFRLNLEQIIEKVDTSYQYTDEDGTIHYFNKKEPDIFDTNTEVNDLYYDEDGLNLTIEELDNQLKMVDMNNNEMLFSKKENKYYLTSIKDIDDNTITIDFNANNSINKIIDKYNNEINIQYNIDNIIIISSDNTITKLNYTNNLLTSIESVNGITEFEYNSNNVISCISDVTGLKTKYEYYGKIPYRVKMIKEFGINDLPGRFYTLVYSLYETSVTDNKGLLETIAFNDYGNVGSRSILKGQNEIDDAYSIEKSYNEKNYLTSDMIPNKYIKNYLKNTSFESDNNLFNSEEGIVTSFDTDNMNSGLRSLKIESTAVNKSIEQDILITKGEYYTFSGYFKNTIPIQISLSYTNAEGEEITSIESVDTSNDFERQDVTILYGSDANSALKIKITLEAIGTIYVDDIQLEKGEVVNYYNIIENSDFKEGLTGWDCKANLNDQEVSPNNYISVIDVNDNTKAVKVNMNYNLGTSFERKCNIKGKEGDAYTISFWFKNTATIAYAQYVGSNLTIFFEPYNDDNGHCILSYTLPITNGNSWQHFVHTEKSIEDFKSIKIIFHNYGSANDFLITDLSFYKDVTREEYNYDDSDNLVSIIDQSNNENKLQYDKENQLVSITDTLGKTQKYEYDNKKKNRLLSTIYPSGIANSIIYKNGNPIINRFSKKYMNNLVDGMYKIRSKGTRRYLKAELNMVLLEESDCSNTVWFLEKQGEQYKIKYNLNTDFSISYRNGQVVLDEIDDNNIFYLDKNEDGSYIIKYNEITVEGTGVKCLSVTENNTLETKYLSQSPDNTDFYIEISEGLFIENNTNYTEDNRFISDKIDTSFRKTVYENDDITGKIKKIINPRGIETEYTYDSKGQVTKIKQDSSEINYTYGNNNLLKSVIQGNKNYLFTYDDFMNIISTSLNNNVLSTNEYGLNNGKLKKINYANNQCIEISYDDFERIKEIVKEDDNYKFYYDTNGNIAKILSNNNIIKTHYDKNNRPYSYNKGAFKVKYTYDSENYITNKTFKFNDIIHCQTNKFDGEKLMSTSLDDVLVTYSYDNLNRNIGKNINNVINTAIKFSANGKRTSNVINEYHINNNKYKYDYDELYNIKNIYLNNILIKQYEYDSFNELIKEKNYDLNTEINYLYDQSGNLQQKTVKNLETNELISTFNYTYENTSWEDQLTSYNNHSITYDNLGNMTSFENNSLSWINGVELARITNNIENKDVKFQYDENGIRKSKVYNSIETKYYTLNDEIIYEDRNGDIVYYLYDSDGLVGLKYNENVYYYEKNLQDDIIGIIDENGNKIVTYIYDSWGKTLSIKDQNSSDISSDLSHIGNINPFRYRSYYYDVETGLYYLNHRYYNPEFGRFISPDVVLGANEDMLSYNLYAYVSNNPISNCDKTGNGKILNKIISAIVNLFTKKTTKKKKKTTTKKSSVSGVCAEKKPSGAVSVTYGASTNITATSKNKIGSVSTSFNTCGVSADHNFFDSYGYDVGPTSADFYSAAKTGDTTYKQMVGIDGDYIYFGNEISIDTGDNESVSTYARINVRKDVAIIGTVTVVVTAVVLPPALAASATAIEAVGTVTAVVKAVQVFTHALGWS